MFALLRQSKPIAEIHPCWLYSPTFCHLILWAASRGCCWVAVLKLVTYSYHGTCKRRAEDVGNGVWNSAPGPAVPEIPSVLSASCAEGSAKWAGDIKSSITPGTVGRRANEQMSHGDWAALWSLNVMGGSVAALKPALHLAAPVPNTLRRVWPWLQEELWLLLSHASSETDEMRTDCQQLLTQHDTLREMNLGLQSFLLVSLTAGPQLLSLCHHSRLAVFCKWGGFLHSHHHSVLPSTWEMQPQQLVLTLGLERHRLLWRMGERTWLWLLH